MKLNYKYMMIINDDSSITSKWSSKLIDDARVIIYDRIMLIIQDTGQYWSIIVYTENDVAMHKDN
jgi:hypothetical protein